MMKTKKYSSYNEITKEYDVYILSKDQYNQLSEKEQQEVKYMVLKKKTKVPPPPEPPLWFQYWTKTIFLPTIAEIKQEIANTRAEFKKEIAEVKTELKQEIARVNSRLDNIVKKNNLKE